MSITFNIYPPKSEYYTIYVSLYKFVNIVFDLFLEKKGPIKGEVILIEQLGTEIIVELKAIDDTFFRFTSPKDPNLSIGELVSFNFNEEFAHLF